MKERNGVRIGQPVRDLDGKELGRVVALYDWAFRVRKGIMLFGRELVARYDEVRGVRDGALVLARSRRDLWELALGELPTSWRVPVPPDYPAGATPSEARDVFAALAAGAIATDSAGRAPEPGPPPPAPSPDEERRYADVRGQDRPPAPEIP